jgi:hypothetical protein
MTGEAERWKGKCATCKHWLPGKTEPAARAVWLVNCRHRPAWVFLPAQQTCERYEPAGAKALAPRLAWLSALA